MDKPSLEEITAALNGMGNGDTLAFEGGGIAHRNDDGEWEVTLPQEQEFFNQLSAAADEYEPGGPRGPELTPEEAFRRMLRGELWSRKSQKRST